MLKHASECRWRWHFRSGEKGKKNETSSQLIERNEENCFDFGFSFLVRPLAREESVIEEFFEFQYVRKNSSCSLLVQFIIYDMRPITSLKLDFGFLGKGPRSPSVVRSTRSGGLAARRAAIERQRRGLRLGTSVELTAKLLWGHKFFAVLTRLPLGLQRRPFSWSRLWQRPLLSPIIPRIKSRKSTSRERNLVLMPSLQMHLVSYLNYVLSSIKFVSPSPKAADRASYRCRDAALSENILQYFPSVRLFDRKTFPVSLGGLNYFVFFRSFSCSGDAERSGAN